MSSDNRKRGDGHEDPPESGEQGALGGDLDRYARGAAGAAGASDDERGALGREHADLWLARPHRDADDRTLPPVEDSTSAFADKVLNSRGAELAASGESEVGTGSRESGIGMAELGGAKEEVDDATPPVVSAPQVLAALTVAAPAAAAMPVPATTPMSSATPVAADQSAMTGATAAASHSAMTGAPVASNPTPSPRSGGEGWGEGADVPVLPSQAVASAHSTSSLNRIPANPVTSPGQPPAQPTPPLHQPPHRTLSPAKPAAKESSRPDHASAVAAHAPAPAHSPAADRLLRSLGRSAPRAQAAAVAAAPTSLGRTSDAVRALRGGPARARKNLAVSHGLLMAIALVMSLLVHTTVGIMISRMPVGQFDASLIEKPERQFKVAPFKDDPIYRDPVLTSDEPLPEPSKDPALADIGKLLLRSGAGGGDPAALSAAALSQAIIKNSGGTGTSTQGAGTGSTAGSEGSAVIASRVKHDDAQPIEARQAIAPTTTTAVDPLPSDVATRLAGGAKVELPLNTGSTGTPGATATDPRPAVEGPTSGSTAKSLLKGSIASAAFNAGRESTGAPGAPGTGGTGTGGAGGPIAGGRIAVADAAPTIDRRLLDGPAAPPSPIEIAALPIQDAVKLDVPEKLDDDFDIAVSRFRPEIGGGLFQSAKPDRYSYFRIDLSARRSLKKLKTIPKDVVFLIDTSGSVPQEWVNNMVSGVKDALSSLNDGDRFNIVFFAEKPSFFDVQKIQPVNTLNIAAAQQFLTQAKSGGDTDINRALGRLLARDLLTERAYYLIFISDGVPTRGVMDNRELINTITRDNDLAAGIYCVGVGYQQNRQLLDYLAYRNKGYSLYAKEPGDAATQIRELASRIRYPIIKGLSTNVIGLDAGEVFPHNLPNIHQGEKLSIFGRYETPSQFTMRVSGHNGGKGLDLTFTGNLATAPAGEKEIPEQWGFWKLHHLYSEIIRKGETPAIKEQIRELKERFDLKTLY